MKKFLTLLLAITTTSLLLTGCGKEPASEKKVTAEKVTEEVSLKGTISTDGSTSMQEVINTLGEAYVANHEDVKFTYNPTGSGSGITAVNEGRCDIGLSSRALKDEEVSSGLKQTILAYDGIAIIVHPDNPVKDLSIEQIKKMYTGEITNWSEVGGNDEEIVLIGREGGSGTRDGFETITETKDQCKYRQELTSTGDVIATVSQNPSAIGYASLSAVKDTVKPLTIEGVEASEATVKDGSYKIQRPFCLITKEGTKLSPLAQDFFDYITSSEPLDLISSSGVVPAK